MGFVLFQSTPEAGATEVQLHGHDHQGEPQGGLGGVVQQIRVRMEAMAVFLLDGTMCRDEGGGGGGRREDMLDTTQAGIKPASSRLQEAGYTSTVPQTARPPDTPHIAAS